LVIDSALTDKGVNTSEALSSGLIKISNLSIGETANLLFSQSASNTSVVKKVIGTGSEQTLQLSQVDLATLGNGTISVSVVNSDSAGNTSATATGSFVLDTIAPSINGITGNYQIVHGATLPNLSNLVFSNIGAGTSTEQLTLSLVATGGTLDFSNLTSDKFSNTNDTLTAINAGTSFKIDGTAANLTTDFSHVFFNATAGASSSLSITIADQAGNTSTASYNFTVI
jgi:hypothetical protein